MLHTGPPKLNLNYLKFCRKFIVPFQSHTSSWLIYCSLTAHLANGVEALTLAELITHLACTLLALLKAAHSKRVLSIPKVNATQIEVGTIQILQQVVLPEILKNAI